MAPKLESRSIHGVIPSVVHLALDVADRSQSTTFALLQETRAELAALVAGGIELAEKATAAVFRLARKATQQVDHGTAETLTGVERLVTSAVKHARDTSRASVDLATTAVGGLTGPHTAAA